MAPSQTEKVKARLEPFFGKFLGKEVLIFEIHNFFGNEFESTLPLPKAHDLNSRWLMSGLAGVAALII